MKGRQAGYEATARENNGRRKSFVSSSQGWWPRHTWGLRAVFEEKSCKGVENEHDHREQVRWLRCPRSAEGPSLRKRVIKKRMNMSGSWGRVFPRELKPVVNEVSNKEVEDEHGHRDPVLGPCYSEAMRAVSEEQSNKEEENEHDSREQPDGRVAPEHQGSVAEETSDEEDNERDPANRWLAGSPQNKWLNAPPCLLDCIRMHKKWTRRLHHPLNW